jgi:hypothetical protein
MRSRTLTAIGAAMLAHTALTSAQSLNDPRMIGFGPTASGVRDSRGFAWNPAGLVLMRDWEFGTSTYSAVGEGEFGFVFHGITLGKRFLDDEAFALEYSPGTRLRLVAPPTLTISGSNLPATNDREVEYREPGTVGFAHRFSSVFSAGVGGRYRAEEIRDTRISLVQRDSVLLYPVSSTSSVQSRTWFLDAGVLWFPSERWTIGLTGRNLIGITDALLPDSLAQFALDRSIMATLGLQFQPSPSVRIGAGVTSGGEANAGAEFLPGLGLALRGALYSDPAEAGPLSAVSLGLGWAYEFLDAGVSYIHFLDQTQHSGTVALESFNASDIHSLDLNPYIRDRLTLAVKVSFGNIRESLARIEQVQLYGAVYPSSFAAFAYRPIGKARIRNTSTKPIEARVSFFVDRFMDAPTESPMVTIPPAGAADVELTAVFNELVKGVEKQVIRDANVYVSAVPAEAYDDRAQARLLFRGRNDWDGNAESLRFFVTPEDPLVLRTTRELLLQQSRSLDGVTPELENFVTARALINGFAGKLVYVNDPALSADYVQYPSETLALRGGDCDDMTVCFSALLSSVGIGTAFVDVVPPEAPGKSHIFLLFDTGLDPRFGTGISENPKRYVVRQGPTGRETIWIPIETTVIARGFDEAWTSGAQQYFDNVELGLGLAKGWVRIVDVKE